jgi:glycosyltransferase involved in cell wall biosynthesis
MRQTIVLVDPISTGHHLEYASVLAKGLRQRGYSVRLIGPRLLLEYLSTQNAIDDGIEVDSPGVWSQISKTRFMIRSNRIAKSLSPQILHYLYLDRFLAPAFVSQIVKLTGISLFATLHWGYMLPNYAVDLRQKMKAPLEIISLSGLAGLEMRILTHSDKLASELNILTKTDSFKYVPYPLNSSILPGVPARNAHGKFMRIKLNLHEQDVLILIFGGTRYDKGADIGIKALSLLPPNYHLLFAGREEYFSREMLEVQARRAGVLNRVHFHLNFIPDAEISNYFLGCDIVLLPYRKIFSGQSGPLTIAAGLGRPVVAPDLLILMELVANYKLGRVYPVENESAMAAALRSASDNFFPRSDQFIKDHLPDVFVRAVLENYTSTGNL